MWHVVCKEEENTFPSNAYLETTRIASKYSEHVKTQSCRIIFMFVSKINGRKLSKEKM